MQMFVEYLTEIQDIKLENSYITYYDIPNIEFYLFGLGNRRKILFKDNKLIDIESGKTIEDFGEGEYLVVPNAYTVLMKQKDGQNKKIYEDENGVFIETNGKKEVIDGTKVYINLYTFDKQKYNNLKRELQGRILINENDKEASEMLSFILNKTGNSK